MPKGKGYPRGGKKKGGKVKKSLIAVLLVTAGLVLSGCHTTQGEIVRTFTDPETGETVTQTTVNKSKTFDAEQAAFAAKAAKWAITAYAGAEKQKAEAKGAKFGFLRDWSEAQQDRMERQGDKWYERFQARGGENLPDLSNALDAIRGSVKGD